MSRLYLIAIRAIFASYIGYEASNSPRIAWSSNKTFIAICLEYKNNSSLIYKPNASTSTQTHN